MFRKTDKQRNLFRVETRLTPSLQSRFKDSWAEIFRNEVLTILLRSEEDFAALYGITGRPNFSVARILGLCFLQELSGLSDQEALDAFGFDARAKLRVRGLFRVHFAVVCKLVACNIKRWWRANRGAESGDTPRSTEPSSPPETVWRRLCSILRGLASRKRPIPDFTCNTFNMAAWFGHTYMAQKSSIVKIFPMISKEKFRPQIYGHTSHES